jgi:carboxylate-amine ligase
VDEARGEAAPVAQRLEELLASIAEDAAALGCEAEAQSARAILARGTSAARQVAIFEAGRAGGQPEHEALCATVDWLAATTSGQPEQAGTWPG